MDISTAYTVMTVFNLLKEPMRLFPYFIGQVIELLISMKRIQEFLLCQNINPSIIHTSDNEEGNNAIEIKNGNFFWGIKCKDDEKKEEEKKKDTKKDEKESEEEKTNQNFKYKLGDTS